MHWRVGESAVVPPNTFAWTGGMGTSGSIGDLAEDDGNELTGRTSTSLLLLTIDGVAPPGEVLALSLDLRSRANTPGLMQRIELWDWTAGAWVDLGMVTATTSESLRSVSATGDLSRYVQPGTGALRGRVGWWRAGPVVVWPWSVHVDQSLWRLRLRG